MKVLSLLATRASLRPLDYVPSRLLVAMSDIGLAVFSYCFSFVIRFEMDVPPDYISAVINTLPLVILLRFYCFWGFGLYRNILRFASIDDAISIVKAVSAGSLLLIAVLYLLNGFYGYPRSVFFIDWLMLIVLVGGSRLAVRIINEVRPAFEQGGKRTLIVGAGRAGEAIVREMLRNRTVDYNPVGFADDDLAKVGSTIHGVKVLGTTKKIGELVHRHRIEEITIAMPSASGQQMRQVIECCKDCRVPYKTLPGIAQILNDEVGIKALRDVSYPDLLRRPAVDLDMTSIERYIADKTVLVTGCGGSIGSELCRQIIRFRPRRLVLLDSSEENLFTIQTELRGELNFKDHIPILGHVQNRSLLENVFDHFAPNVVFHAAACKHVPMMEIVPWEAVFNNIFGSYVAMEVAGHHAVDRFVLVSTDKAVQPTSVMGASKRVAELLLHSLSDPPTKYMAVRFGNVLGSSGSVVPVFRRQIEIGGPITITHPEITRYFMLIPEAAQLILQAGALGKGREVFVLRMGTPIKISELASDLIKLSGKEPGRDIEIVYTGLRDGEKLYEDLITPDEQVVATVHGEVSVVKANGVPNGFQSLDDFRKSLNQRLSDLYRLALEMNGEAIKAKLKEIVPEYSPETRDCVGLPPFCKK